MIAALSWTTLIAMRPETTVAVTSSIERFLSTFVIVGWLTGNLFRIHKQATVEKNFDQIEVRMSSLMDRLEKHTTDLLGQITGGDGLVTIEAGIQEDYIEITLRNETTFPIFDLNLEYFDLTGSRTTEESEFGNGNKIKTIPMMKPGSMLKGLIYIPFKGRDRVNINFSASTRTENYQVLLRVAKPGPAAMKIINGRNISYVHAESHPDYEPSDVDSIFRDGNDAFQPDRSIRF